jgi:uncharacterized membrane protein YdjX (TVP38/TMEM64 family)/rhodanese-related sulfurtransferase
VEHKRLAHCHLYKKITGTPSMNSTLLRTGLFIVIIAGIALGFIYREQLDPTSIQNSIENAGTAAPIIFMLVYITGTIFFLPGSVLTLLGGALFGPIIGTFINLTAATIGAMISFLISRFVAADWVAQKTGGRLKQLINGVENEGWRFVAFTRLVPLFPFNLLNYALGLTKIPFAQYSIASYICMFPGALAYTYLGYIGKEAATGGEGLIQKAMLALALLAVVAFIPRLVNKYRKVDMIKVDELKSQLDDKQDILLLDVRPPADFTGEQGHIEQAMLIPLEELPHRVNEIKNYKTKTIVTICRTDRRSSQAAKTLSNLGFENVKVARMGMTDWNKNNYPLS